VITLIEEATLMKKIFGLLAILAVAFSLTACGGNPPPDDMNTGNSPKPEQGSSGVQGGSE
jgi:predicted small lipoprotein YifL